MQLKNNQSLLLLLLFFFTWLPKRLNPLIASRAAFAKPTELKDKSKYFTTLIYLATKQLLPDEYSQAKVSLLMLITTSLRRIMSERLQSPISLFFL